MVGHVIAFNVLMESDKPLETHLRAIIRSRDGRTEAFKFPLQDTPFFTDLFASQGMVQIVATDEKGFSVICRYS